MVMRGANSVNAGGASLRHLLQSGVEFLSVRPLHGIQSTRFPAIHYELLNSHAHVIDCPSTLKSEQSDVSIYICINSLVHQVSLMRE
jgi:hypothetical protein